MAFTIYKSEFAVRAENDKIKRENEKLKAEVYRLKQMVGEPVDERELAKITAVQPGETFQSGDCQVQISAPKGGATGKNRGGGPAAVEMNPAIQRRRPGTPRPAPAVPLGADLPASTQGATVEDEAQPVVIGQAQPAPDVDNSEAGVRFRMIELR